MSLIANIKYPPHQEPPPLTSLSERVATRQRHHDKFPRDTGSKPPREIEKEN